MHRIPRLVMRHLLAALLALCALPATAAITNANFATTYTTVYARPITFSVTNGRDLFAAIICDGGTLSSVTDNSSGTPAWSSLRSFTDGGNNVYIYGRANVSGSPTTVNVTCSLETFVEVWLFEDDATADAGQPGSSGSQQYSDTFDTSHTANLTVPNANDLVILMVDPEFNGQNITAPTGWARVQSGTVAYDFAYNTTDVGSGSQTAIFTLGGSDNVYFTATYFTRGGGGGSAAVPLFHQQMTRAEPSNDEHYELSLVVAGVLK